MSRFLTKIRTVWALGLPSLTRFFFYRFSVKAGLNPVRRIQANISEGVFFTEPRRVAEVKKPEPLLWANGQDFFHWFHLNNESIPQWFASPLTGKKVNRCQAAWWKIPDFDPDVGDIKAIWEASRFDWVLTFSQQAANGDLHALRKLNEWLIDWVVSNRPYIGPNWKCGQEASFRIIHLAMAAVFLGQLEEASPALISLVKAHLKRIAPTIQYAIAQDNNHGTSEAAALFIGGSWIALKGDSDGLIWARQGRKWLENRAKTLILDDGSFSQYSVTYHRLMLDTYSFVEVWRRRLGLPVFSVEFCRRLGLAAHWLYQMVQKNGGDAPNIGANDGALLMSWGEADYRDFRPSVQLSMALFSDQCAFEGDGAWNIPLLWFDLPVPSKAVDTADSRLFDKGGFCVLRNGVGFVLFRFPVFKFRPSQADLLHLDLWSNGQNLLRDGGTYSYNTDLELINYFSGTAGHNTIQFDGQDQMPRLGRFLFGDWLKVNDLGLERLASSSRVWAAYRTRAGIEHKRTVELHSGRVVIKDDFSGFGSSAVLRWRLKPGEWVVEGDTVRLGGERIRITGTIQFMRFELKSGFESRYYLKMEPVPILEVEVAESGVLLTEYNFKL